MSQEDLAALSPETGPLRRADLESTNEDIRGSTSFISPSNEVLTKYCRDDFGLHRLVLDYFLPRRVRRIDERVGRWMQRGVDEQGLLARGCQVSARFVVIFQSKVFCVETLAFAMLIHRAINQSNKIKYLFANYLACSLILLSLKRFFWRNRPYRKGLRNLLPEDEWSSFPSTNIFLAVTLPFSIMRVHRSRPFSYLVEIPDIAKLTALWTGPLMLSKIYVGSTHLTDALASLLLVGNRLTLSDLGPAVQLRIRLVT